MALTFVFDVQDNGSATFKKIDQTINVLNQNLTKVDNTTNIFNRSLGVLGTAGANFLGNLAASGVSKLKDLAKEMVDSYDSAAKLSQNIGVASDSIIGLRHAAELSNVGAEQMDKNMVKLSKTIADAAGGSKSASEAFGKMGIEVKNADGSVKNSEQVLMEMADTFQKLPPGAQRATLAMDVFGKQGANMVSMLKDGSGALKQMSDDGKLAAGDIDSIAKTMQDLKDAGTDAKAAMQGFIATLADNGIMQMAIQSVKDLSKAFLEWRKASKAEDEIEKNQQLKNLANATGDYYKKLKEVGDLEGKLREEVQGTAAYKKMAENIEKAKKEADKLGTSISKLNGTTLELSFFGNKTNTVDQLAAAKAELDGIRKVYNGLSADAKAEADTRMSQLKLEIGFENEKLETIKKNKKEQQAVANAMLGDDSKSGKGDNEAAKRLAEAAKLYEAENKRLQDWLANYEKAKRTETEIAFDSYQEQEKNFNAMLERGLIDESTNIAQKYLAHENYQAKIKELLDKEKEEFAKAEAEKLEAAEKARQQALAAARQHEDKLQSLKEIAAQTEAERIELQKQQIETKYAREIEAAQGNAETIAAIEAAKNAELRRQEEQLRLLRLSHAQQYADSLSQLAGAAAALGKASGNQQKAIAISQAIINTAVAATKAASSAPWPLNMALVAGAMAQGTSQIATIKAQKFASGGMIPGSNTLIMANEEGREAILNTRAVRAIGGEAGVNALNRGTSNTYNNSTASTVNINMNTAILTQKTFRDEIEPVLRRAERRR
ncbi:hypothetical protein R83H12_00437 [Fibrobacteria bacterium R8-3-H12]